MMDTKDVPQEEILNHLPLVKSVAFRLFANLPNHVDFDDLIGYGVLGLMEALRSFNPHKNVKFSTFAFYRIRGAILDGLRAQDWLPRPLRHKIKTLESSTNELKNKLGRDPSDHEVAEYVKMPVDQVRTIQFESHQSQIISLEEQLQDIAVGIEEKDSKELEEKEVAGLLAESINSLEEKERLAVTLYYYEGLNLKEIGKVLSLSESRISQLLSKVMGVLREKLKTIEHEI
jgi:RNA polymerase sigma factor FliA